MVFVKTYPYYLTRWEEKRWRGCVYTQSQQPAAIRKINKRIISHPVMCYFASIDDGGNHLFIKDVWDIFHNLSFLFSCCRLCVIYYGSEFPDLKYRTPGMVTAAAADRHHFRLGLWNAFSRGRGRPSLSSLSQLTVHDCNLLHYHSQHGRERGGYFALGPGKYGEQ